MEQVEQHIEQPTNIQEFISNEPVELLEQQSSCVWKKTAIKTTGMVLVLCTIICLPEILSLLGLKCDRIDAVYNYLNSNNLPSGIIGTFWGLFLTF